MHQRGFAFIAVVLVVFVVATIGAVTLSDLSLRTTARADQTSEIEEKIYRAITGDRDHDEFGYLGDVGDFPNSLMDLVQKPASNPLGWSGPYVSDIPIMNGQLADAYGSPLEYYLDNSSVPPKIAIISRGADRGSTNTAAGPNDRAQFAGTLPTDPLYATTGTNADNIIYPDFATNVNSLAFQPLGTLAYTIMNYDLNSKVDALVPACPSLYTIGVTSIDRGATDLVALSFAPGLTDDFVEGGYNVAVLSQMATGPILTENIEIQPNSTAKRYFIAPQLDSRKTPIFALTVVNNTGLDLDINDFNKKILSVDAGMTATVPDEAHACANMKAETRTGTPTVVDSWVMPWGAYNRIIGGPVFVLTVTNTGMLTQELNVFQNGVRIGSVNKKKTLTFGSLPTGSTITVTDKNGVVLQTFAMSGNMSVSY